ncbi:MAG: DUF2723 domain-containing protein [Elusimicrobia bacterium]|nr:DUF2723 domain-containing protein [Elusimicrobiota bacterium]
MKKSKIKKQEVREIDNWQDFIFPKKDLIYAAILTFAILIVYLLVPCRFFYFDGLMYASIVEAKEPGWATRLGWANHLSFNYYGHIFWRLLKYIGIEKDGYSALQIMNSFFGAVTVGIFFLFLKKLIEKKWLSGVFSLLLAFSYAFWYRSVDAQVYPSSVFWLTVSFILTWSYVRQKSKMKLAILSVTSGLAVLAHQGNIFFLPTVIAGIVLAGRKNIKNLFLFGIIAGFVVAVPYLYVLTYQEKTLIDRNTGSFAINETTVKNSFNWIRGNIGSYSPEKYTNPYWQPQIKHIITDFKTMIWGMWFAKGSYYSYGYPSDSGKIWMLVSKIIFILFGFFLFFKEKIYTKYKTLFYLALTWWLSYIIFVSWFNPGNPDYWYQHWVSVLAVYCCAVYEFLKDENTSQLMRKSLIGLFFCSIAIIPVVNFFDSIYPISIAENNENYIKALFVKKYVKKGGVVIISGIGWNPGKVYIPSFANVGRISFDLIFVYNPKEQGLQILKNQVEMLASQGMDIYVLDEIFYKVTEGALKQWNVTMDEIKEIFSVYEFKTLGVDKDGMKIMQMFPKKGSAAYHRREGIKFYNLKDYKNAADSFLKIPPSGKTSFDYKLIGNSFLLLNDKENAVANWKAGYKLNPSDDQLKEIIRHYGQ